MTSLVGDLLIPDIHGVRECSGAYIHNVSILTRKWHGDYIGEGSYTDEVSPVKPIPGVVDRSQKYSALQGGRYEQGDLLVKSISKGFYTREEVQLYTESKNIEKFYLIDERLYTVINVVEKYLSYDVHIREVSHSQGV